MDLITIDTTVAMGAALVLLAIGAMFGAALGYYAGSSDLQGQLQATNRKLNNLRPHQPRRSPEPVKDAI